MRKTNFGIGFTVWVKNGNSELCVQERCFIHETGDYIGMESKNLYPNNKYYHSKVKFAITKTLDFENKTGMQLLRPSLTGRQKIFNRKAILIEESHNFGDDKIYRGYLPFIGDSSYFNEKELIIIED